MNKIASLFKTNVLSNGQYIQSWKYWEKIETLSPNLLSFVVARMCSMIDSGEKEYKLLEQILFNFLVLFPTLYKYFVKSIHESKVQVFLGDSNHSIL